MDRRTKLLLVLSVSYLIFLMGMVALSLYLFFEEPAEPEPGPEPNDGHMSPLGHFHDGSFCSLRFVRRPSDVIYVYS